MKRATITTAFLACAAGLNSLGGCASVLPLQAVPIVLGGSLTSFALIAGQPNEKSGTVQFESPFTLGRGTIALDPDAVSFTPTGAGKIQRAAQDATTTIIVTVWIAEFDQEETVFDDGDEYGPFTVTFNADFSSATIDPSSVTLTQQTIDLLNSGMFSIGLRIESDVDGTLTIENLTFNVGL